MLILVTRFACVDCPNCCRIGIESNLLHRIVGLVLNTATSKQRTERVCRIERVAIAGIPAQRRIADGIGHRRESEQQRFVQGRQIITAFIRRPIDAIV